MRRKNAFWMIAMAVIVGILLSACYGEPEGSSAPGAAVPDAPGVHTEYDGVYLSVGSVKTGDEGQKIFSLVWNNETPQLMCFGHMYSIEYRDGDEWKDVSVEDHFFFTVARLLYPESTLGWSYSTQGFDLSRPGTYRLRCQFSRENGGPTYNTWIEFEV